MSTLAASDYQRFGVVKRLHTAYVGNVLSTLPAAYLSYIVVRHLFLHFWEPTTRRQIPTAFFFAGRLEMSFCFLCAPSPHSSSACLLRAPPSLLRPCASPVRRKDPSTHPASRTVRLYALILLYLAIFGAADMPGQYLLGLLRCFFTVIPLLAEGTISAAHAVSSACRFRDARLLLQLCAKRREMATFVD